MWCFVLKFFCNSNGFFLVSLLKIMVAVTTAVVEITAGETLEVAVTTVAVVTMVVAETMVAGTLAAVGVISVVGISEAVTLVEAIFEKPPYLKTDHLIFLFFYSP
jgi:hypothetical protein